eukprot:845656-Rhodomonas_salina.2
MMCDCLSWHLIVPCMVSGYWWTQPDKDAVPTCGTMGGWGANHVSRPLLPYTAKSNATNRIRGTNCTEIAVSCI